MRCIITNTFQNDFDKYRGKSKVDIFDFSVAMKSILLKKQEIHLSNDFYKIKLKYQRHTLRILVVIFFHKDIFIPMFITDKNDNLYGYNMNRNTIKNKAKTCFEDTTNDLKNKDFQTI